MFPCQQQHSYPLEAAKQEGNRKETGSSKTGRGGVRGCKAPLELSYMLSWYPQGGLWSPLGSFLQLFCPLLIYSD